MLKKDFLKNTIIVSVVSLSMSVLGVLFRTYASNRVGSETMGLLQLVLSVYYPACTVASSGVYVASTRLCAEALAQKKQNIGAVLSRCLIYGICFGFVAFFLLFFGAEFIATRWLSFPDAEIPLKILSLGLPFLSAANALQGYFLALRKASYSTVLQVTEDLSKIGATVLLFTLCLDKGPTVALCALVAGMAIGEIVSCLFGCLLYWAKQKGNNFAEPSAKKTVFSDVVKIAFPCAFSAYLRSGLGMMESILVPRGLEESGLTPQQTLSVLGKLEGMTLPILLFPATFLSVVSKLLVPEIAAENASGNKKSNLNTINFTLKWTLSYGIFIGTFLLIFGYDLGISIYRDNDCGRFLMILAPMVPILYGDRIIDGIMKGYDKQLTIMRINLVDAVLQTVGAFLFIPKTGIFGYLFLFCFGSTINFTLSYVSLRATCSVRISFGEGIFTPLLCSLAATLPLKIANCYHPVSVWIRAGISIALFILFYNLCSDKRGDVKKNLARSYPNIPSRSPQARRVSHRRNL